MVRIFAVLLALAALLAAAPAKAGNLCQGDDAALQPLPAALVPEVQRVFGLQNEDAGWARKSTVIRCMGGKTWACNYGANLPCGKANTSSAMPAGDDWCKQNPNSDFIPAYITGHDSIRQWRCVDGAPAATGAPAEVDAQGFLVAYWKVLN
jgi:hypothetical protein